MVRLRGTAARTIRTPGALRRAGRVGIGANRLPRHCTRACGARPHPDLPRTRGKEQGSSAWVRRPPGGAAGLTGRRATPARRRESDPLSRTVIPRMGEELFSHSRGRCAGPDLLPPPRAGGEDGPLARHRRADHPDARRAAPGRTGWGGGKPVAAPLHARLRRAPPIPTFPRKRGKESCRHTFPPPCANLPPARGERSRTAPAPPATHLPRPHFPREARRKHGATHHAGNAPCAGSRTARSQPWMFRVCPSPRTTKRSTVSASRPIGP